LAVPCFHARSLFDQGGTVIERVSCDGSDGPRQVSEQPCSDHLVVTLRGRYSLRHRRGRVLSDPSRAVMFRAGEEYVTQHPDGGDECLCIGSPFYSSLPSWQVVPIAAYAQVRLHLLSARLQAGEPLEALEVDETLAAALDGEQPRVPRPLGARGRAAAEEIAHEVALHFDRPLPLADLAARARLSPFAACRLFPRATGFTIHQYQIELRLRHALALLLDTRHSLAEIALESGFANQGHFGNHFRRRYGVTPGQARMDTGIKQLARRL
jgi:AraC family transcriptional regulator